MEYGDTFGFNYTPHPVETFLGDMSVRLDSGDEGYIKISTLKSVACFTMWCGVY